FSSEVQDLQRIRLLSESSACVSCIPLAGKLTHYHRLTSGAHGMDCRMRALQTAPESRKTGAIRAGQVLTIVIRYWFASSPMVLRKHSTIRGLPSVLNAEAGTECPTIFTFLRTGYQPISRMHSGTCGRWPGKPAPSFFSPEMPFGISPADTPFETLKFRFRQ